MTSRFAAAPAVKAKSKPIGRTRAILGIALIGLTSAALSYYLFGVVLSVPLPRGILFD